jgi:N-acetylglucosaminyldiphosphoundecaprenol N-acetyl-beta-D-mannosaminyltransferase
VTDERVGIVGIPIDWVEMDQAVARIMSAASTGEFFQVATVNLDFLVQSRLDPEVALILRSAAMNIADGAPVVWLGRIVRAPRGGRVAGADLVPELIRAADHEELRVFFLGGEDGAAEKAATRLRISHPRAVIDVYEPPRKILEEMEDEEILRRIDEADPQVLLVAFGHPKQEKWIFRHRDRLPMVAIGVGCCFDLIAGRQQRAPMWMQKLGLEWAYRFAREPLRLRNRYVKDALSLAGDILPATVRQRLAKGAPITAEAGRKLTRHPLERNRVDRGGFG